MSTKQKDKSVCSYLSLYHIKRQIVNAILECVDKWNKQQHHSTFKLGIEVKAVFTKNHPSIQNPEADPLIEHRIMTTPLASTWVQHATHVISSIKIVTSSSLCCFTTQEAMTCILSSKKMTKMKYGCEFEGIPNS